MALRLLTSRVIAPTYMPVIRNSATLSVYRGYASKFSLFYLEVCVDVVNSQEIYL